MVLRLEHQSRHGFFSLPKVLWSARVLETNEVNALDVKRQSSHPSCPPESYSARSLNQCPRRGRPMFVERRYA